MPNLLVALGTDTFQHPFHWSFCLHTRCSGCYINENLNINSWCFLILYDHVGFFKSSSIALVVDTSCTRVRWSFQSFNSNEVVLYNKVSEYSYSEARSGKWKCKLAQIAEVGRFISSTCLCCSLLEPPTRCCRFIALSLALNAFRSLCALYIFYFMH